MSDAFLVLHGLAIKKAGTAEAVAETLGGDAAEVEAVLQQAVSDGRAVAAKGRYMLTPAGQQALAEAYPERFAGLRSDEAFQRASERFEAVNRELKALVTDWQSMPVGGERVPNDHSDPEYDRRIIDRLGELHERAELVLKELAQHEERLQHYIPRLQRALERAEDGELDYVSAARIDSYHTLWFDLHEDLLRILGREREE